MKDQIVMLEDSLRTNIQMARAMTSILQFTLARKYLANAHKDKRLLATYKAKWNSDITKTIEIKHEVLNEIRSIE